MATYKLKVKGSDKISKRVFALCKHNYIQAVGKLKAAAGSAREDLHFASTFTYILWEGKKVMMGQ